MGIINNFVKICLDTGNGILSPIILKDENTNGTGLANPSVFVYDDRILCTLRHINYTLYYNEITEFHHFWGGPLQYVHPEDDYRFVTTNYLCEFDKDLNPLEFKKINTSALDTPPKSWFQGHEDVRLYSWDNKLLCTGSRRDVDTRGTGRMEVSELSIQQSEVVETNRWRIPAPGDNISYCEKNWMPVLDKPWHYIKWTNPTEVVRVNPVKHTCETVIAKDNYNKELGECRGGSQIVFWKGYYLGIVHQLVNTGNPLERKGGVYCHRFILWDTDFNIVQYSKLFNFLDAPVEFCAGLAIYDGMLYVSFGFQDCASFLIKFNETALAQIMEFPQVLLREDKMLPSLHNYIQDPSDPLINFKLATEYEDIGQTAAAVSFYLRAAERTHSKVLQYCSLVRTALCFIKQGSRDITVKTLLQRAIGVLPDAPEAYYFLSNQLRKKNEYHDAYLIASLGVNYTQQHNTIPEYSGRHLLIFEKLVNGWEVGVTVENKHLFDTLYLNYFGEFNEADKALILKCITNNGNFGQNYFYNRSYKQEVKYPFSNLDQIDRGYAQVCQDMFVLSVLNGLIGGTFIDFGSNDPFYCNNTALLETKFNWSGVSFDIDPQHVEKFNKERNTVAVCVDVRTIDLVAELEKHFSSKHIDYVSIDCDEGSVAVLNSFVNSGYTASVITFEHDAYRQPNVREISRSVLEQSGYVLVVPNLGFNTTHAFEDWWVHHTIDVSKFETLSDNTNFVQDVYYKQLSEDYFGNS